MSADAQTISSQGLSRRSFLMAVGLTIMGKFLLPNPTSATGSGAVPALGSPAVGAEARVAGRICRLLAGPVWNTKGTALAWLEKFDEDEQPHVMSWYPEADDERAEAKRFFGVAMWRTWRAREELRELLRRPGPWLIRQNFQETYCFLRTTDEAVMLDTERDEDFSYDPERWCGSPRNRRWS
jgi:hypothetical protein